MRHDLRLDSGAGNQTLEFSWDSETGELGGRDANTVRAIVDSAMRDGYTIGPPFPTRYDLTDPLRKPAEMAALLLSEGYQLPPDLAALLPEPESLPDDAIA